MRDGHEAWTDLNQHLAARQCLPPMGYTMPAGGWVLAESFDQVLRQLSPAYLQGVWTQLDAALAPYGPLPADLAWGGLHPGLAFVGTGRADAPTDYFGVVSSTWSQLDDEPIWAATRGVLAAGTPALQPGACYRGLVSRIPPDDAAGAFDFFMWTCVSDPTGWHPDSVAQDHPQGTDAWMVVSRALGAGDQAALDGACAAAQAAYTPASYAMVIGALTLLQESWGRDHFPVVLPPWPAW